MIDLLKRAAWVEGLTPEERVHAHEDPDFPGYLLYDCSSNVCNHDGTDTVHCNICNQDFTMPCVNELGCQLK